MEVALIMLIILMVLTIIFIPIYIVFYRLTNYSDEYPWAKKMMKGWLIVITILGLIFTFFFFVFLAVNLGVSGICFYSNEILVNNNFAKTYQTDLNIKNE